MTYITLLILCIIMFATGWMARGSANAWRQETDYLEGLKRIQERERTTRS